MKEKKILKQLRTAMHGVEPPTWSLGMYRVGDMDGQTWIQRDKIEIAENDGER